MIDPSPRRLYLLRLATSAVPAGDRTLELVLGCYLVQTGDGKRILIDSGYPPGLPLPPGTRPESATNVIDQLAQLAVRPEDIDLLICTHFDVDHAGYHDVFTRAELVVQRKHYDLARSGHPRYAAARAHWDDPALKYRLIDGDTEILPGVTLIETSGHTTGHQSVLVRLPATGPVLLAIDAVAMQHLFVADRASWPLDENEEQLRTGTRRLLELVERERVALVIFGHDGRQWRTLKTAPDYYS